MGERVGAQCWFCGGTYEVDPRLSIETASTADPSPPAAYCVSQQGVVLHLCERGVQKSPEPPSFLGFNPGGFLDI